MKKLLPTISVFFGLFLFFFFTPSPSLARNQTSTVGVRLAYEGQFINCEEEAYLIRCLTPECDDYSEIYWDEPHGDEQGYYYFVFYNVPYSEYAVHIKGCDHAKGRTLLTTGETRIIVDQPDELEDVVVVETEPCSCESISPPPPSPTTPPLPSDFFPAGSLTCTPDLVGDRDSRPYYNYDCDLCNITGNFCPSCATSFTVFDEVKWQRKERDLVCEGEGNPDWKITPWEGSITIDPTDTKIPFVGKKRVEISGRVDKEHEDEEKYLADYFEGTHGYYRRYPLSISFPILGDVDFFHGVNPILITNYQGVFRKLAPMGYQDQLKEKMIERARETMDNNIHEGGVHNYELNYVKRICWNAPFWLEVAVQLADSIVAEILEKTGIKIDLELSDITHYCIYGYNTTFDYPLIKIAKEVLDKWNKSDLVSLFPFLKISYFYQTALAKQLLDPQTLVSNIEFPPDPSEKDYVEKWNDWKFKNLEKGEFSDSGKLWEMVPMFSREDTPGKITPYLGSKPLDTFIINNPGAQVEKVPHVARLYEASQEVQNILIPHYEEDLQFVQNKSEPILASAKNSQPIIASPAEKKVQGEKILLAQGPGCVPCGYKYYYGDGPSGDDCSCMGRIKPDGEPECRGEPSLGGGCPDKKHWHIYGTICGWSDPKPIERGCNPPDKLCCGGFVNPNPPPDIPACGLPEAWPVDQCEMLAITDPNENDGLCCEPINIKLEAKDMFNDYPYTPCDYSCGPTGTELCNPECNTWEHRTVNREIGINLLHPYLTDVWEQTGKADTQGLFNLFRPAKVSEFQEIDATSQIVYSQSGFKSIEPSVGKFYFNYLGGVQLSKEWVINTLMPYVSEGELPPETPTSTSELSDFSSMLSDSSSILSKYFATAIPRITPEEILHFNPDKNSGWLYIAQTVPEDGITFWLAAVRSLSTNLVDNSAQLLYGITNTNTGEYYSGFLDGGSFSESPGRVDVFYEKAGKKILEFSQIKTDLSEFELKINLPWNGSFYQATKTLTLRRPILYESGDGIVPIAEGVDSLYVSLVTDQGFWIDFQKFNLETSPLQISSRFHEANHRWGSFILNKGVGPLPAGTVGVAWEILDENNQRQPGGYTNIDLLIPGYGQVTAEEAQIEMVGIEEIEHWNSDHKTYLKKWKITYPGVDLLFETVVENQENEIMGNYFYEGIVKVFNPETGQQVGTGMLEQTHNEAFD